MGESKKESGIAEQLRAAIEASGLSLNELGKQADINHSQLSRFMRAERGLTLEAATRLCEVLGLQLADQGKPAEKPAVPPAVQVPVVGKKTRPRKK